MDRMELFRVTFLIFVADGVISKSLVFNFDQNQFVKLDQTPGQQQQQQLEAQSKCGYESCNPVKDGMINVHLVPHTHNDVGWLKTVDQYFYGDYEDIQYAGVQYILDSLIPQLQYHPEKRFIYVEMAFFKRWWDEQHDSLRHVVKGLVSNGQLEFILGGWCMNDEATTHYNAIIDQHTLGFRFLEETFGECGRPRVAWQIDPFGHSREQASLFAQMGFDGLFFGRLDYQDKDKREKTKTMEMVWKGSANLGEAGYLFTGVLPNNYSPPRGFCFDAYCKDIPIMDDERLHDYNVPERVGEFLQAVKIQAEQYATDHLIMTMGNDFDYSNANMWYKNLDKLIKYVNEQQTQNNSKVNLLYSTPSCYLYQLNRANKTWTTKDDDFFPYAHRANSFWTGYFTSRPALKGYVRQTNNFLQVCKQLDALALLEDTEHSSVSIQVLKEALGLAQHHDAVSGTEKQPVAYDYAMRLARGVAECQKTVNDAYKKLLNKTSTVSPPDQSFCGLLNISMCNVTENNKQFVLIIYNPIGRSVNHWVRLPVAGSAYQVTGPDGKTVPTQMVPVSDRTKHIPERNSSASNELVFQAQSIPALGFATYFVQMTKAVDSEEPRTKAEEITEEEAPQDGIVVLKNAHISLTFDGGELVKMDNFDSKISLPLTHNYAYYLGHDGNNSEPQFQASGAYVFRPKSSKPVVLQPTIVKTTRFEQGQLVQEVTQTFSPWVTQVVRLYEGAKYAEFEWTVGPIPVDDKVDKEVISVFQSNLGNAGTFYTDANGREILQRKLNYRPTWNLTQTEPVAGNYYPINSRIFIRDEKRKIQLTVLTDRSQGGASINEGEVEIMVHRRGLLDDGLGVGEGLNETGADRKGLIVRGKHYVFMDTIDKSAALHRDMALQLYMAPSLSFVETPMKPADWSKTFRTTWSGLLRELPANVHLLSLEQWRGNTYLVRLENFYEKKEDATLSKTANVSMEGLFTTFEIATAEELMLGGNQKTADSHRLKWNIVGENAKETKRQESSSDPRNVTLTPMQIRTYQAAFTPRT